jgi:hypothetical protein
MQTMTTTPTTQHSRHPAVLVLAVCAVVVLTYFRASSSDARQQAGANLEEIELAIADPDAPGDLWLLYGERLSECGRYGHAIMAFRQVLELDPYCRPANIDCATAFARGGDADGLYEFVSELVLMDPRLTQDVLARPEFQPYLSAERFRALQSKARTQSMD